MSNGDLPRRAPRPADAHKGGAGRVLVIGGSRGLEGAVVLAATGALRSGAGLVTVAAPAAVERTAAGHLVEAMTLALPGADEHLDGAAADAVLDRAGEFDAAILGPGMGRHAEACDAARRLFDALPVPAVVDADALHALSPAGGGDGIGGDAEPPAAPRVLTPHPGEMARLLDTDIAAVQANRTAAAERLAAGLHCTSVLKGAGTVVAGEGGVAVNDTGNPGMATGGTGDVLCGVIAALLADTWSDLTPWQAARLGVHVHGSAGDAAAADVGPVGFTAGDVAERLPAAFAQVARSTPSE